MSEEPATQEPERHVTSPQMDPTIRYCGAEAIEMKRRLNQELPISRLPPELVLCIMNIVRSSPSRTTSRLHSKTIFPWVQFTHTFHYWRNIAIDSPTLWDDIVIDRGTGTMVREWLLRSQHAPLTVQITGGRDVDDMLGLCDLVLSQGHRIRKLDVLSHSIFLSQIRWSRLTTSAAFLQSLHLHVSFFPPSQPFVLPAEVKNWIRSSSLVDLAFREVPPLWNTSTFPPTIKELYIFHNDCWSGASLSHDKCWGRANLCSLDTIIADLNALPLLNVLQLERSLSKRTAVRSHRKQIFRPIHLRTFLVSDSASNLVPFLDQVELPACCTCRYVDCWLDTASTWEDIVRSFIKLFDKEPPSPTLSFRVRFEGDTIRALSFGMSIWRKVITIPAKDEISGSECGFSLTAMKPEEQRIWDPLAIARLCQALPLQTTEVLSITGYPPNYNSRTSWASFLFRETTRVRVMEIWPRFQQNSYVGDMLWALVATVRGEDTKEGPPIIFPELGELNLAEYGFTTAISFGNRQLAFWELLLEALSFRKVVNGRITRLVLSHCTDVTSEHIERLEEVADEVVWLRPDPAL